MCDLLGLGWHRRQQVRCERNRFGFEPGQSRAMALHEMQEHCKEKYAQTLRFLSTLRRLRWQPSVCCSLGCCLRRAAFTPRRPSPHLQRYCLHRWLQQHRAEIEATGRAEGRQSFMKRGAAQLDRHEKPLSTLCPCKAGWPERVRSTR